MMTIQLIYSTNHQYEMRSKLTVEVPDSLNDYDSIQKYCYEVILQKTENKTINLWQFTNPNHQELKQLLHE